MKFSFSTGIALSNYSLVQGDFDTIFGVLHWIFKNIYIGTLD